jgi:hypothetical protein
MNTLPIPYDILDLIVEQTSFQYNLDEGGNIGGYVEGHENPLWIILDDEDPTSYNVYVMDDHHIFRNKYKPGIYEMDIEYTVNSVEELIEVIKKIEGLGK